MKITDLLLEANVVNADDILDNISYMFDDMIYGKLANSPEGVNNNTYGASDVLAPMIKRAVVNNESLLVKVTPSIFPAIFGPNASQEFSPGEIQAAQSGKLFAFDQRNEELYRLMYSALLFYNELNHDYDQPMPDNPAEHQYAINQKTLIKKLLSKVNRMSVYDWLKKSEEYKSMTSNRNQRLVGVKKILDVGNGWAWYFITNNAGLQAEADAFDNCIAGNYCIGNWNDDPYKTTVTDFGKSITLLILKDPNNRSRAITEFNKSTGRLSPVEGLHYDTNVNERYKKYIQELQNFLNKNYKK